MVLMDDTASLRLPFCAYRTVACVALHVVEDPAWLALVFC